MRTVLAVAMCLVVGACATSGENGFDPYGIWDVVSAGELNYPNEHVSEFYFELRPDGSWVYSVTFVDSGLGGTVGTFSLGEEKDGCWPIKFGPGDDPEDPGMGSMCGREMTVETKGDPFVLHKRR